MKRMTTLCAAVALSFCATVVAEETKSGLQPGDAIGAFDVVKVAGAEADGIALGKTLCYRCKYGSRPMVMVFTRNPEEVSGLIAKLNSAVEKNSGKQLKAFVNVLGEDRDSAESAAKKLGSKSDAVPVVVPVEFENGPGDYGLNAKVNTTIIIASGSKVQASHAINTVDDAATAKILADVEKLVK